MRLVTSSPTENFGKFRLPVEDVDAVAFLVGEQREFGLLVKIRADERVAAFDVVAQIGQRAFRKEPEDGLERLAGLAFQHFQQQRELGDFHRLRVNVHAVNVGEQNPFAFGDGEFPARAGLDECGAVALGELHGIVGEVELQMPVEQELIRADEE